MILHKRIFLYYITNLHEDDKRPFLCETRFILRPQSSAHYTFFNYIHFSVDNSLVFRAKQTTNMYILYCMSECI